MTTQPSRIEFLKSIIGSCDCFTKTPEIKYHDPLCKYRLISERDALQKRCEEAERMIEGMKNVRRITPMAVHQIEARCARLEKALGKIEEIEDAGWDELDDARKIAREALAEPATGGTPE